MPISVELINSEKHPISIELVQKYLNFTLRQLGLTDTLNIELVIVNDQEMIILNKKFRDQQKTTDVLSFENPTNKEILGSIVISYDTAKAQAAQAGTDVNDEVASLANHGLLHLLGYDHV